MSVHAGILLPVDVLTGWWFSALAGFVAFNTLIYAALAVGKILPRVHLADWWYERGRGPQRRESRSIYAALPEPPGVD